VEGAEEVSDVRVFPGVSNPEDVGQPVAELIEVLEKALAMAKSGQLQCYIGTGFTCDHLRLATWCDRHENVYEMAGALAWLQAEYMRRHTEAAK
jgi:hypothetical protein